MSVFSRFLYAMFAVGIFLLAYDFSMMKMREKYYDEVFGGSLTDETSELPEFYYFYASLPDYHKNDPVILIDIDGYQIRGYEIARAIIEEETLDIEENLFFIVYHEDSDKLLNLNKLLISTTDSSSQVEIILNNYQRQDVLVSIDSVTSSYLVEKSLFDFTKDYTSISVLDKEGNTILNESIDLTEADFTLKTNIDNYYEDYQKLPTWEDVDLLEDNNVFPKETTVSNNYYIVDNYGYIMGIVLGSYVLVLIISTYLIFFKRWRR